MVTWNEKRGTGLKSIHVVADSEIREFIKESETSRVPGCPNTRDEKYHVISPLKSFKLKAWYLSFFLSQDLMWLLQL